MKNDSHAMRHPQWLAVLKFVGWCLLLAYFPVTLFFVAHARSQLRCEAIKTNVHADGGSVLISDAGLLSIVKSRHPELIGSRLDDVDYASLEAEIETMPMVRRCDAYPTAGGSIHVDIYQRKPIMRIFAGGSSYYMDEEGYKITATSAMRAHTLIVNGHVNSMISHDDLIALCRFISRDDFWSAMIEQVYVTKQHEYILVPRVGNHVVEFGKANDIERKFDDLKTLYKKGWDKHEWNVYKKVSLKFSGQIVCTRR